MRAPPFTCSEWIGSSCKNMSCPEVRGNTDERKAPPHWKERQHRQESLASWFESKGKVDGRVMSRCLLFPIMSRRFCLVFNFSGIGSLSLTFSKFSYLPYTQESWLGEANADERIWVIDSTLNIIYKALFDLCLQWNTNTDRELILSWVLLPFRPLRNSDIGRKGRESYALLFLLYAFHNRALRFNL